MKILFLFYKLIMLIISNIKLRVKYMYVINAMAIYYIAEVNINPLFNIFTVANCYIRFGSYS